MRRAVTLALEPVCCRAVAPILRLDLLVHGTGVQVGDGAAAAVLVQYPPPAGMQPCDSALLDGLLLGGSDSAVVASGAGTDADAGSAADDARPAQAAADAAAAARSEAESAFENAEAARRIVAAVRDGRRARRLLLDSQLRLVVRIATRYQYSANVSVEELVQVRR